MTIFMFQQDPAYQWLRWAIVCIPVVLTAMGFFLWRWRGAAVGFAATVLAWTVLNAAMWPQYWPIFQGDVWGLLIDFVVPRVVLVAVYGLVGLGFGILARAVIRRGTPPPGHAAD
jgi:hypothetical protein